MWKVRCPITFDGKFKDNMSLFCKKTVVRQHFNPMVKRSLEIFFQMSALKNFTTFT